jgi:hypothetical protein
MTTTALIIIGLLVLTLVVTAVFAFVYRARGGAIPLGSTTLARLVFWFVPITIIATIIALVGHMPWWLGLVSGGLGFGMEVLGHSFAQNNDPDAEAEMGLVVFTDLIAILLPFAFFSHIIPFFAILGLLAWPLSRLSYLSPIADWQLTLFGITWCRTPAVGGSEWEEMFVGATVGLTFALILDMLILSLHII